VLAWRAHGTDDAESILWRRVAYSCRYGRIGLGEAMGLGQDHLQRFIEALGELVKDENPTSPSALSDR
jgi:hypothetical protein